jgi:hypothetical protein
VDASPDRLLLVGLVGLWFFQGGRGRTAGSASSLHWIFGLFGILCVLSILLRAESLVRLGELEVSIKNLALLASYGAFFALAASTIRPSEVPSWVKLLVGLGTVTGLAVVIENRFGINPFHDWIGPLFPGYVRPEGIGTIDDIGRKQVLGPGVVPLTAAVMFSLALPFALVGMIECRGRRRIIYAVATCLLLTGALATSKKTGLVGPAVAVIVLAAYRPRGIARLAPFGVVLLAAVHFAAPGAIGNVADQFSPKAFARVNTTQDRLHDYQAVTPDLAAHPLVGRGYGSYDQKQHRILDNQYLTLAIGVGLLGLIAYLAIFGSAFVLAHREALSSNPHRGPPALAAAAAIAAMAVISALLDVLSLPQLPYLFSFIAALVVVMARGRSESSRPDLTRR